MPEIGLEQQSSMSENWTTLAVDGRARLAKYYDQRIIDLIVDIKQNGRFGRPEALHGNYAGWFSRRISSEKHRLVYQIDGDVLRVRECGGHYSE